VRDLNQFLQPGAFYGITYTAEDLPNAA